MENWGIVSSSFCSFLCWKSCLLMDNYYFLLSKQPYQVNNNGGQQMVERDNLKVFSHPNYDSSSENNDFALLKLDSPVSSISPVNMDQNSYSPNYDESE